MRRKLLLSISGDHATVAHWRAGRIVDHLTVQNSEDGVAACRALLAGIANVPAYILVDAVEEDYRTETLPHVRGADRRELIARKLRQHYRGSPYCAAGWQGREPGGRRDDRYQFAALTNPDLLAPWIELLEELKLPLAGIHLLPMAGVTLLPKLRLAAPHVLLVATTGGGLRLTYFRAGQFRLSRLTRFDAAHERDRVKLYVDEIANTRLYLHALHAAALDEALGVVLLDPLDTDADVAPAIAAESPALECVHLGSRELARTLRLRELARGTTSDVVFLHLLALQRPTHNLAPPAATGAHRRLRLRNRLYGLCAGAVATMAAGTGYVAWQLQQMDFATQAAARERLGYEQQYQAVTRSFPAAPASAATLQQAVEVARRLRQEVRTPERAMAVVSRALTATPGIVLNELAWKDGIHDSEATAGGAATGATGIAPPTRSERAVIKGEVRPFAGDYRAAIATIRELTERLARDPGVREARITRLPLNIDPAVALSGNTRDAGEPSGTADFAIQIDLRPGA